MAFLENEKEEIESTTMDDMSKIDNWLRINVLTLNIKKTVNNF